MATDPIRPILDVHLSFQYEVSEATTMLMYQLAGIEAYHSFATRQGKLCAPNVPGLCVCPIISGPEPNTILGPDGRAAQLAYRGWIDHIATIWEHIYRVRMKEEMDKLVPSGQFILPKMAALGDLQKIRNDFAHHYPRATESGAGKCIRLRWFKPGDVLVLSMTHVLDFLNHLGLLSKTPTVGSTGAYYWKIKDPDKDKLLAWDPPPKPISVRTDEGPEPDTIGLFLVFDNGFFTNTFRPMPERWKEGRDNPDSILQGRLNQNGDTVFPGGFTLRTGGSYVAAVEAHFEPSRHRSGGVPGPSFRIAD
ncbi:MAG: hypothetical protein OXU21_05640 [Chloroflexota bacterium]|nr:hypothetical protein [Chloroflexota bacterium]